MKNNKAQMWALKYAYRRRQRYADFKHRCLIAPTDVCIHAERAWKYIPIHCFADELTAEEKLYFKGHHTVDCWWGVDGDATLLQCKAIAGVIPRYTLQIIRSDHAWIYLSAELNCEYITPQHIEEVMNIFYEIGFPKLKKLSKILAFKTSFQFKV